MTQIEIAHRNSNILKSAREGHTIKEIAEIFSMNPRRIMTILKSSKVKAKRPTHALESVIAQNIIKELIAGTKQSDIAKKYYVSRQYVSQIKFKYQALKKTDE